MKLQSHRFAQAGSAICCPAAVLASILGPVDQCLVSGFISVMKAFIHQKTQVLIMSSGTAVRIVFCFLFNHVLCFSLLFEQKKTESLSRIYRTTHVMTSIKPYKHLTYNLRSWNICIFINLRDCTKPRINICLHFDIIWTINSIYRLPVTVSSPETLVFLTSKGDAQLP